MSFPKNTLLKIQEQKLKARYSVWSVKKNIKENCIKTLGVKNGKIWSQLRILPYIDSEIISKENWRVCSNWLYWDLITPISINENEMCHLHFHIFQLYLIFFWNFILDRRCVRINNNDQTSINNYQITVNKWKNNRKKDLVMMHSCTIIWISSFWNLSCCYPRIHSMDSALLWLWV